MQSPIPGGSSWATSWAWVRNCAHSEPRQSWSGLVTGRCLREPDRAITGAAQNARPVSYAVKRVNPMPPLDEFKREVVTYLPGLFALFDIADSKRRNFHLGHRVVDREIDELDRQIRTSVGASGLAKRVGGDEWLALYKTESVEPVAALLRAYHKEEEFLVGWKCTGERDGQIKVAERTVPSKLVR